MTDRPPAEACPLHLLCWLLFHGSFTFHLLALGTMHCLGSLADAIKAACWSSWSTQMYKEIKCKVPLIRRKPTIV